LVGKLNSMELKRLPAGFHADGAGLYLDVQESGSRSWILRTSVRGKRKDIGLGGLATKSLAEARQEAAELRGRAKKGEDILENRRTEKRIVPTFKEASLAYHDQISESFDSEQHAHNWLRSLEQYVFPAFGQKSVDAIDGSDVLLAINPIWMRIPDTARRTLRRVKAIFDNCADHRKVMVGNLAIPLPFVGHVPMTVSPAEASDAGQASLEHTETLFEGTFATDSAGKDLTARLPDGVKWSRAPLCPICS
jgi:hypothetical protein